MLKGNPKILGSSPSPWPRPLFFHVRYCDGPRQSPPACQSWSRYLQSLQKYYLEKLILPLDSQTQCFLFDVQLLWSYDYSKWAIFLRKTAFYYGIFKFWEAVKWGLKIFAPNYQKAHPNTSHSCRRLSSTTNDSETRHSCVSLSLVVELTVLKDWLVPDNNCMFLLLQKLQFNARVGCRDMHYFVVSTMHCQAPVDVLRFVIPTMFSQHFFL